MRLWSGIEKETVRAGRHGSWVFVRSSPTEGTDGHVNLPNFITLGRVFAVPVIFWLLVAGMPRAAFLTFLAAGASDAVDGFLAKRFNMQTQLGAYLDPIADKLLITSIYIALGVKAELPIWLVTAVVSRDILIVLAIMLCWLIGHPVRIRPLWVSKWNTLAQVVLAATVLADEGFQLGLEEPALTLALLGAMSVRDMLTWITGILTLLSLAAYMRIWLMHMTGYEPVDTAGHRP